MMNDATTDQPMHHGAPAHALERLVFFSDAVFAISITLLGIELKLPHFPHGASDQDYLTALVNMLPQFTGFFVSFFVVGAFWNGHHRAFTAAQHWSPRLVMPNLLLLCSVAAMPFFTAFMSDNPTARVPTIAYCLWLIVVGLCNLWNNSMAVTPPVAADGLDPDYAAMIRRRGWAIILGAATALIVAWFNPLLGQPALATILLWRKLLEALHQRGMTRRI